MYLSLSLSLYIYIYTALVSNLSSFLICSFPKHNFAHASAHGPPHMPPAHGPRTSPLHKFPKKHGAGDSCHKVAQNMC